MKRLAKLTVLHIAKTLGLFALLRAATSRQARILCYHGGNVGDECKYNPKLFCKPAQLEQRLRWLRAKGFVPASLDEVANLEARTTAGIPVALTLDDGWYSSYRDLLPLMARYGHHPSLYLHTEVVETGGPVIDVCLGYIFWKSGNQTVSLTGLDPRLDGEWKLGDKAHQQQLRHAAGTWLRQQPPSLLAASIERFAMALGLTPASLDLSSRRFSYMSKEELAVAAAAGCAIELHGHTHEYATGEPARNKANIDACRKHIVDAGLGQPRHYCYPSGVFDAQAPYVMRAANVATATTCLPGLISAGDANARFFLPRFLDGGDVSMIEFEAEMSGVLDLLRSLLKRQWINDPLIQESETELSHSSI